MDNQDPRHNDSFHWDSKTTPRQSRQNSTAQLIPIAADDDHSGEPQLGYQYRTRGKKSGGGLSARIVALCLCCALLGGVGGGIIAAQTNPASTTIYKGDRPPVEVSTVASDTKTLMSATEVYAAYVNSTVGITVDIVSTNIFGQSVTSAAAGSGFVITEDGYIVTNHHVIEGANAITVTFSDGESYDAVYVGGEKSNDVAIIKIDASGLLPVILGTTDNMHVGDAVVAIGNPLGELTFSMSDGIISALARSITMDDGTPMNMIQTNTAINSGNSGGPLFNMYGEVVGIVSAKYSSEGGLWGRGAASIEGLGFAIPMDDVADMLSDIIENGYVTKKPYLGITVQTVMEAEVSGGTPAGAEILYCTPGLCADDAGLREGDIIIAVEGITVTTNLELINEKNKLHAGDRMHLTVYRDGQTLDFTVTLDEENTETVAAHEDYSALKEAEASQRTQPQERQDEGDSRAPGNHGGGFGGNGGLFPFF